MIFFFLEFFCFLVSVSFNVVLFIMLICCFVLRWANASSNYNALCLIDIVFECIVGDYCDIVCLIITVYLSPVFFILMYRF